MSTLVTTIFVCIFIAFSVFALKETGYLKAFIKAGFICFFLLLVASFCYGLFNDFSFIHGSSPAGLESAFTCMMLMAFFVGPIVFIVAGLCGVLIAYLRKKRSLKP
jgi:FtsH-binding integral membrane protein